MVVIKSLQLLPTAIEAALKETSHYGAGDANVSNGSPIRSNNSNMLHIALVGIRNQMSTLQDRFVYTLYSLRFFILDETQNIIKSDSMNWF
jgi:hypothetical protein